MLVHLRPLNDERPGDRRRWAPTGGLGAERRTGTLWPMRSAALNGQQVSGEPVPRGFGDALHCRRLAGRVRPSRQARTSTSRSSHDRDRQLPDGSRSR